MNLLATLLDIVGTLVWIVIIAMVAVSLPIALYSIAYGIRDNAQRRRDLRSMDRHARRRTLP